MKLSPYLTEDGIDLCLSGADKRTAIQNLAERLRNRTEISDFEAFVRGILGREEECTTGIGEGVAIPHTRTNVVSDFVVAVGRIPGGIDFEAIDGDPVDLVILMGTSADSKRTYLQFLATLNLLLKRKNFRKQLRAAQTPAEVIEVFKKNEEGL